MAAETKTISMSASNPTPLNEKTELVPILLIMPNPYQPESRLEFPVETVKKMAASIMEHGLLQMPVARVKPFHENTKPEQRIYEMADGWLRLSAYRYLAQEKKVKGYEAIRVAVRVLTDSQMADMVIEANTVRQDLTPIDKAKFYKKYIEDFKVTQEELAKKHNCSQGEIANTIRLLDLPEDIQAKIISQEISETHGRSLLQLHNKKTVNRLVKKITDQHISVADLEREIKHNLWNETMPLTQSQNSWETQPLFNLAECQNCENKESLKSPYGLDNEKKLRCTDKSCWNRKQSEALTEQNEADLEKLKARGITRIVKFDYKTMTYLQDGAFKECDTCPKKAAEKSSYNKRYPSICTDKKCHSVLTNAKRKANEQERADAENKYEQTIDRAFENVKPGKNVPLVAIDCLLRSLMILYTPTLLNKKMLVKLDSLFRQETLKQKQNVTLKSLLALFKGFEEGVLYHDVIPRISFEVFRNCCSDWKQVEQMIEAFQVELAAEKPLVKPGNFTTKQVGHDWVAVGSNGDIIAIASKKDEAFAFGVTYVNLTVLSRLKTRLNPPPDEYMLNHTYRIGFKHDKHLGGDVLAQDANEAIRAFGGKPENVELIKVYKSSGKIGTDGGCGAGWSKCTEKIEPATDSPPRNDEPLTAMPGTTTKEMASALGLKTEPAIPLGVRLAEDVPNEECHNCKLQTEDHTLNFGFPTKVGNNIGYQKICLKDYDRVRSAVPPQKTKADIDPAFCLEHCFSVAPEIIECAHAAGGEPHKDCPQLKESAKVS